MLTTTQAELPKPVFFDVFMLDINPESILNSIFIFLKCKFIGCILMYL
jgi:hypothetical protein